ARGFVSLFRFRNKKRKELNSTEVNETFPTGSRVSKAQRKYSGETSGTNRKRAVQSRPRRPTVEMVSRALNAATLEHKEKIPAAQYVRMSTDLQELSIANQETAISDFAARFGYTVVKTYADAGRSGVSARTRPGLCRLLSDVIKG